MRKAGRGRHPARMKKWQAKKIKRGWDKGMKEVKRDREERKRGRGTAAQHTLIAASLGMIGPFSSSQNLLMLDEDICQLRPQSAPPHDLLLLRCEHCMPLNTCMPAPMPRSFISALLPPSSQIFCFLPQPGKSPFPFQYRSKAQQLQHPPSQGRSIQAKARFTFVSLPRSALHLACCRRAHHYLRKSPASVICQLLLGWIHISSTCSLLEAWLFLSLEFLDSWHLVRCVGHDYVSAPS